MKRYYYISEDLDDLENTEQELENAGVSTPQIHVLSDDDAGVKTHNLHEVEAVLKKDVVHSTQRGAVVGVIGAITILLLAGLSGLTETYTWVPAILLAIIVLGFATWEGGFIGIQKTHVDFQRFRDYLAQGKHVLFVDVDQQQEGVLRNVIGKHPHLTHAGVGTSTPRWVVMFQQKWNQFVRAAP
jgi:hypothetical protein